MMARVRSGFSATFQFVAAIGPFLLGGVGALSLLAGHYDRAAADFAAACFLLLTRIER